MRNTVGTPYTGLTVDQKHDLNMKLYDMVMMLDYNVDAPDLRDSLQTVLEWYEMD